MRRPSSASALSVRKRMRCFLKTRRIASRLPVFSPVAPDSKRATEDVARPASAASSFWVRFSRTRAAATRRGEGSILEVGLGIRTSNVDTQKGVPVQRLSFFSNRESFNRH